jgi:hypothetical protein
MATDLQPVKPAPALKYDAFVEAQLRRARQRIRGLDLAAAGLGFLALTLGYGLAMALCDRWLELPSLARQGSFALYLLAAVAYLSLTLILPLFRRINPYYAARKLEVTLPECKNSVVNWLDLRHQPLAAPFRSAIGHRAAKDLAEADLDQAIYTRRNSWLGGLVGGLFVACLLFFILGPRPFLTLMQRAFAPFSEVAIATRTRLTLIRPEGGDTVVPVGRAVSFAVLVDGHIPDRNNADAVRLLYRYNPTDLYEERLFERGSDNEWVTTILASEVPSSGFWYKVAGGDTETEEYRVQVRSSPLLERFDVTYHYRPYLGWRDRVAHERDVEEVAGTEVSMVVHTNRQVRDGQLTIAGKKPLAAELLLDNPQAMRFRWPEPLKENGTYEVRFTSVEGERSSESKAYSIKVRPDKAPLVELKNPGKNIHLPANGLLQLEGSANDDFGIARMTLRMKVQKYTLQAKPYRGGTSLRFPGGGYPQVLEYKDHVELDKVKTTEGKAFAFEKGQVMEYWLEAEDACDFPTANVGSSPHYTVTIDAADKDEQKQQQERQAAQKGQQEHEQKQDQDLKQEQNQREKQQEKQDSAQPKDQKPGEQGSQGSEDQKLEDTRKKLEEELQKDKPQRQDGGGNQAQKPKPEDGKKSEQADPKDQAKQNPKQDPQSNDPSGKGDPSKSPSKPDGKEKQGNSDPAKSNPDPAKPNSDKGDSGDPKNEGSKAGPKPENQAGGKQGDPGNRPPQPNPDGGKPKADKQPAGGKEPKPDNTQKKDPSKGAGQNNQAPNPSPDKGPDPNAAKPKEGAQPNTSPKPGEESKPPKEAGAKNNAGNPTKDENQANSGNNTGEPQGDPKKDGSKDGTDTPKNQGKKPDGQQGDPKKEGSKENTGPDKKQEPKPGGGPKKDGNAGKDGQQPKQDNAPKPGGQPRDQQGNNKQETQPKSDKASSPKPDKKDEGKDGGQPGKPMSGNQGGDSGKTPAGEKPQPNPKADKGANDAATDKKDDKDNPSSGAKEGAKKPNEGDQTSGQQPGQSDDPKQNKPKPDGSQGKSDQQKTAKEIEDLAKALGSADQKTREDAAKKLDEIRRNPKNEAERKAVEDALKKAGERTRKSDKDSGETELPGKKKPTGEGSGKSKEGATGQPKANPKEQGNEPGNGQNEQPGKPGDSSGKPGGKDGNGGQTQKGDGQPGSSGKQPGTGSGQNPGGGGGQLDPNNDRPNDANREIAPPPKADDKIPRVDKGDQGKAGDLQLEDLRKRLKEDKDALKRLKWTDEDVDNFIKSYKEAQKRKHATAHVKDDLVAPKAGNRVGPSSGGVRKVNGAVQDKADTILRGGPALAPVEYRPAQQEFSRKVSELKRSQESK